jgi:Tfp pilus assembly protein PilE
MGLKNAGRLKRSLALIPSFNCRQYDIIFYIGVDMKTCAGQRGFSLIGLLLSAVIVSILLVMALQTYQPVLTGMQSGTGPVNSVGMNMSRVRMRGLAQAEAMYYAVHREYGTWDQLVADGQIQQGYSPHATGSGTPFVPCHDIEIQVTRNGFVITATPNTEAGAPEGSPVLRLDQTGRIEEVQAE